MKKEIINYLKSRIEYWSFHNHHCKGWRSCEPEEYCENKWHGYCGYEMDHGIEVSKLQSELEEIYKKLLNYEKENS